MTYFHIFAPLPHILRQLAFLLLLIITQALETTAAGDSLPPGSAQAQDFGQTLALILSDKDDAIVLSLPVTAGDRFGVAFTHSLALSRVEEFYEVIGPGEFRLRETVYADFGAGLPHEETPGLKMEFDNGHIRLHGFDIPFEKVWLRIGHIADHRLLTPDNQEIRLADFRPPGSAIQIRIIVGENQS